MNDDLDEFLEVVGTDVPTVPCCSHCGGVDVCADDCPNIIEYLRTWEKCSGFVTIYGGRLSYGGTEIRHDYYSTVKLEDL
jgi:hypothetical protein